MSELVRFGVAMEQPLLDAFDALVTERGHVNRSHALRDLVRRELDRDAWKLGAECVATISLVYDHHARDLTERLTELQHDHEHLIVSALHVHLDHAHCLEVIAARGPARELEALADALTHVKGVLSGQVAATTLPGTGGAAAPGRARGGRHAHPPAAPASTTSRRRRR
ncbi:MAG: nickel-responsive transcriptional regulator NikR [Polyangiaceae bacterium]|nr:nickel-responsive transcriptional regulator NikR [Polyangiaceae bacterium]